MEIIKSPQDNLEAYLCNSINIEIYKELTKIDALEFFNKLYYEFDFFQQNIKNYLKIINHFEGFDSLEEHNKLKEYPFLENYVFYFYESLNKLITKHYPVESREDRIIKSCEHIEEIYKRLSISVYGTYSQFESFLEEIEDFEDEAKIKSLIEFKYLSLKNPQIFISNQGIPFDEKCELEIRRLKELLKLESETFISLPAEPEPIDLSKTSGVEQTLFINKFDSVKESRVVEYFKENLVDKKYITEQVLNEYLKTAFEKKEKPKQRFSFDKNPTQGQIKKVFYNYYKVVAGKPYGKQQQYVELLGDYFSGFNTQNLITNFSK